MNKSRCFSGNFSSNRSHFARNSNRLFTHFKLLNKYTTRFQKSQVILKLFFSSVILTTSIFLLITANLYTSFSLKKDHIAENKIKATAKR